MGEAGRAVSEVTDRLVNDFTWQGATMAVGGIAEAGAAGELTPRLDFNLEEHRLLPKEFVEDFGRAGLKIEDYTVDLPTPLHRLRIGEGLHTTLGSAEGEWNAVWRRYLAEYPVGGPEDAARIIEQMERMIDVFSIWSKLIWY